MGLLTLHLAIVRLHHQWPLAAAQGLGLFAAVALAVTVPLVQSIASEAGLRSVVENLGSSGYVTIEQLNVPTPDGYDAFQRDVSAKVLSVTRDQLVPAARYAQGPKQTPFQLNGQPLGFDPGEPLPDLATWERLEQHVNLVSGGMPADGRDADGNYPFTIAADGAHDF